MRGLPVWVHRRYCAEVPRDGFGRARSYFLAQDGKQYDSKAIAGYAHGQVPGQRRWTAADFSGGDETVARHLGDRLGFDIKIWKRLHWTRDEIILACDLVWANNWHELRAEYPEVVELSGLLQRYWAYPMEVRTETFRNPNSVGRKTTDIATQHPDYQGAPTRGGRLDREVLAAFLADPAEMHRQAKALRSEILAGEGNTTAADDPVDLDLDDASATEGGLLERIHLRYERDPGLRNKAVKAHKSRHGHVACEACGFNFESVYGDRGTDFIECHHKVPLSESGVTTTTVRDFALLCSNCHRMIHRRRPWLTLDQLIDLISAQGS